MATMPEAETTYQTEQAAAPARQEAAVKSIAPPPQPAPAARPAVVPAAAPQAQAGLFDRIFGWFKKRGDETPAVETPAAEPVAAITRSERPSERRGERSKPGQRRGRGEGRNGEGRGEGRVRNRVRPSHARARVVPSNVVANRPNPRVRRVNPSRVPKPRPHRA